MTQARKHNRVPRPAAKPAKTTAGAITIADLTLLDLAREWLTLGPTIDAADSDAEGDLLWDRLTEVENQILSRKAETAADAIAMLEVARSDMVRFKFAGIAYSRGKDSEDGQGGDGGDVLALTAIDNALRVLRSVAGITAASAASAAAAPSLASNPMPALFREWWTVMVATTPATDAESTALCERGWALKEMMFARPTTSAQDLAMKLIVEIGNGDYEIEQDFIDAEIRPLIAGLETGGLA